MLRHLDYQDKVLSAVDTWIDALIKSKRERDALLKLRAERPEINIPDIDFSLEAWKQLAKAGQLPRNVDMFSPRLSGVGEPVPNAILKVPTGGGKTLLAAQTVTRVLGRYLCKNTGFVLWIVPSEAIFSQTLNRLKDRQHPYRQILDRAAAGKVRILEKNDPLNARDVEEQLCVMLLMLPSANRQSQDQLKMFQDRGDVRGFFPPEGEQSAHLELINKTPNLEHYGANHFSIIKDSLGNALRIIRPVVVLDEGHKATSELAFRTLYGFNPCCVIELTATPKDIQPKGGKLPVPARYANILVEVSGRELDREGMIKMPLILDPKQSADWKLTLKAAIDRLDDLQRKAVELEANTKRYIRPIMLIQLERTGQDKRSADFIHAEDVKDWLKTIGFADDEIAIKTSETNDLANPENQNLLDSKNRVRAIITKSALQEGWDCPFAYVLCSLAASSSLSAMTQLVGRILRQPEAMKTGVDALDSCYVVTHRAETKDLIEAIKKGLESDGLGDLILDVTPQSSVTTTEVKKIKRRDIFSKTEIYLPKVLWVEGSDIRDLDYDADVLSAIDFRGFNPHAISQIIPENGRSPESQLQRIALSDDTERLIENSIISTGIESLEFDPAYATRLISDIVPNPFVGREIIGQVIAQLRARNFDDKLIGKLGNTIIEEIKKGLEAERSRRAEAIFRQRVSDGIIQFRLRLDGRNWRMPFEVDTRLVDGARILLGKSHLPIAKSLFDPIFEDDLNGEERGVAVHLDGEGALKWWHRNVAQREYSLQGWRRGKIYPDFIFAVERGNGPARIVVLETKGDHLDNLDTSYKRAVLDVMSQHFAWDTTVQAGTMELVQQGQEDVVCELILMSDINSQLPKHFT